MLLRLGRLMFTHSDAARLVTSSYDRISGGYDDAWTLHMRDKTLLLIEALGDIKGCDALDLTCGTGYATGLLAQRAGRIVTGVDASGGMLDAARGNCGEDCRFVQSDVLEFLKSQQSQSLDIITCCWGLGYSRPLEVIRQCRRLLRTGGRLAIIDNSIFSLREVMYCSFLTFLEQPQKLVNLMKFRFLTGAGQLRLWMFLGGLKPVQTVDGQKSYWAADGKEAIARLRATGAAAGFEYASTEQDGEQIFSRFAQIIDEKYLTREGIEIIHRFYMGIAIK